MKNKWEVIMTKGKKIAKLVLVVIFFILLLLSITGCTKKDEGESLREKVHEEIHYLEAALLQIANHLNNIELSDSKVSEQTMNLESKETAKQGEGEEDGSSSQSENMIKYEATPNVVIGNDRNPDWQSLKKDIELLSESWATAVLDLYQIGIPEDQIIGFSNDLNVVITNINAENKIDSLNNVAKLYNYLPNYLNNFLGDQEDVQLVYTKAYLVSAYTLIEQENWDGIRDNLNKAEESYTKMLHTEQNKNKGYILLKEFQNAVDMQNKDVLYVKYKNAMEEMNVL